MITISKSVNEDSPKTVTFTVPGIKANDWVGVSIETTDPNLRYSAYCDTDDTVTVVLNYVPTAMGQGQASLSNAPISFKY